MAFSMLFKRPLVILLGHAVSTFGRIQSLLDLFSIKDCKLQGQNYDSVKPFDIDYSMREKVLSAEREKAFNFLSNALGVKPKEIFLKGDEKTL